jgi:hypothetical protein
LDLPIRPKKWKFRAYKRLLKMPSLPLESIYTFAVVLVVLGGCALLARLGAKATKRSGSNQLGEAPRLWGSEQEDGERTATRRPSFVPPPMPTDDREYFQAVQDAREHDLPSPLPPSGRDRDEW